MALAIGRVAIARLSQHAVGTNAGLGVHAPEQAIVAGRHGRVGLCVYEQPFPAQSRAKVGMSGTEALALGLGDHAAPPVFNVRTSGIVWPAARSSARFTAIDASLTLYPFWLSGRALLTAAAPAALAVCSSIDLPAIAWAASSDTQGTGATAPITMRAL